MKNILDKINRANEIQANLELDKTELGKHEVELGYLQTVQKDAESQLKKYSDIKDLIKYHNEAQQWVSKNKKLVEDFNSTRNIYLDKLNYELDRMKKELQDIDSKFKSIGIKSEDNVEYKTAFSAIAQLTQLFLALEQKTQPIKVTFN